MTITPDIPGFVDAQERLRDALGVDAIFITRTPVVWPEGTQLNPETGRPHDPTVKPTSGDEEVRIPVRCSALTGVGIGRNVRNPTSETAAGSFRHWELLLAFGAAHYDDVKDASEVELSGRRFRVRDMVIDPAFNQGARYVVYGEAK